MCVRACVYVCKYSNVSIYLYVCVCCINFRLRLYLKTAVCVLYIYLCMYVCSSIAVYLQGVRLGFFMHV